MNAETPPPSAAKSLLKGTKVYGASDDLIEFDGDVDGEVGHYSERPVKVYMSDGTVLSVLYGKGGKGIWTVKLVEAGPLFERIDECHDEEAKVYSDVAYFKPGLSGARCKGKVVS